MVWIVDNVATMLREFGTAASVDPVSAVLVACGVLLVTFAAGLFGVLTVTGLLAPLLEP